MRPSQKLNATVVGSTDGRPMLMAHGFGCDQHMWRLVAPAFTEEYQVITFDFVGAGGSDVASYDSERYATLEGYAEDVLALVDDLDLHDVVFVGHSVSAMIGALAAIAEPDRFDRLVMVGPSPAYIDRDGYTGGFSEADIAELLDSLESNYLGWSAAMAPAIMGRPDRPELGAELTESFCRMDPRIAREFARVTFLSDVRDRLAEVSTPTLVLQCRNDLIAPVAVGEYVRDHVQDGRMTLLEATGHCPHLSAPAETIAAMREFLRTSEVPTA